VRDTVTQPRVQLRVHCDFDTDIAQFSYGTKGAFKTIGGELRCPSSLKTFQGVRYALFHYNTGGSPGGQADFDNFTVDEPRPRGLTRPIQSPAHRFEDLANGTCWRWWTKRLHWSQAFQRHSSRGPWTGAIALQTNSGSTFPSQQAGIGMTLRSRVTPRPSNGSICSVAHVAAIFGHASLVVVPKSPGPASADHPGPAPDRKDGFLFSVEGCKMKIELWQRRCGCAVRCGASQDRSSAGDSQRQPVAVERIKFTAPPWKATWRTTRRLRRNGLPAAGYATEKSRAIGSLRASRLFHGAAQWSQEIHVPQTIEGAFAQALRI